MQQYIQQFIILSERIILETGELRLRRSWNELSKVSNQLASYMKQLSQSFATKYALLYLLSCGNDSPQKNACFSMLFRKILSTVPNREMFSILSAINRVELNSYILPFLYENGTIGSVALYTSAKLGLKVKQDSFEFFLNSREWSQEDLINLSLLVLTHERNELIQHLTELYNSNQNDAYARFLNIINVASVIEPILPNNVAPAPESSVTHSPDSYHKPLPAKNPINTPPPAPPENKFKLTSNRPTNTVPPQQNINNVQINAQSQRVSNVNIPVQQPSFVNTNVQQNNQNFANTQNNTTSFVNNNNTSFLNTRQYNQNIPNTQNRTQSNSIPAQNVVNNTSNTANNQNEAENFDEQEPTINANESFINKVKSNLSSMDNLKDKLTNLDNYSVSFSPSDFTKENIIAFVRKPQVLTVIIIILIIMLWMVSTLLGAVEENETTVIVKRPPKEGKIPDYWVDAVSNKKLTPQYLQADVDYRTGEIYLSQNKYNEAISFFQMALKTEPKHNIAKLRWGYTELMLGNSFSAERLLKEVLADDSKMQNANLYLARNYYKDKKFDLAETYFKKEYNNFKSLDVGMEYANFLSHIGKKNESMEFLATLQEKNPDKMLVLDAKPN